MQELIFYFNAGGCLMYPLLLCSLIAVAVIIERAVRLTRSRLLDPNTVEKIQTHIESGEYEQAIGVGKSSKPLVGRILSRGLEEFVNTSADIETSLVESGERGLQVLHNNLSVLALISRIAPLLGLLGTVLGMIKGFAALEAVGVGKEALAGAIKIALITTASGLIIAIPSIVANTYFGSRIRRLIAEFEEIFIDIIKTVKNAPAPSAASEEAAETEGEGQ